MIIGIEAAHANKEIRTGVEWYCFNLIQELKKIIPPEVSVILYTNKPLSQELGILPSNWKEKVLSWKFKKGWSQFRLSFELLRHPPDIFFAPGQLVPFVCVKNTIATIHDSAFLADKKSYWFFSRFYLKLMNRLILRKAKTIIATADFNVKELYKFYGKIKNNIKVIPLAYDKKFDNAFAHGKILEKYNIEKPYIISVGRLEEKKNTKRLIEAFNLLKAENRYFDLKLVLVGKPGVGYKEVEMALEKSAFKKDIISLGYVDGDLQDLLKGARALVFPSLYEGFGIPVLEAMACGTPVVAASNTALVETGGDGAVYVNPFDTKEIACGIKKVLEDKDLRARNIQIGLERVKNYSWEKTAMQTWEVLKNVSQ